MSAQLLTVRHMQAHERPAIAALLAGRYPKHSQVHYEYWLHAMPHYPDDRMEDYRVALLADEPIAALHVSQRMLHYGQATLHVACLSNIVTHSEQWQQKYADKLLRDVLTYVAEQGAHLVLVDGLGDHYKRYGFTPIWPRYTMQTPTQIAAKLAQPLTLREAYPDDAPRLAALYNRHWGHRVTFSRKAALWHWLLRAHAEGVVVAQDATGLIQGYLWHNRMRKGCIEVVVNTAEALSTLLAYEGKRCQAHNATHFMWSLLPDDIIVTYAQHMLPITLAAHYSPNGGWMGRIIDSSALVQQLLPEIIAQAQVTDFRFQPDQLLFKVASDAVDIGLRQRPETHCRLPLRDFMQILFGSLRPATLALRLDMQGEAVRLLETLFPPRMAGIAAWDWF